MSPLPPPLAALKAARQAGVDEACRILEQSHDGLRAARHLSAAQDCIIAKTFTGLAMPLTGPDDLQTAPFCLCASGGYGRGELAPGSDLDLLFLHEDEASKPLQQAYSDLLYLLWDCGLKVGHALRRPDECAALAAADTIAATALMDTRVLAGNPALAANLKKAVLKRSNPRADRAFIAAKLVERDTRHMHRGRSRYRVEPHVKDGKGGLRDLQTLGWIARRLQPQSPSARAALAHFLDAPGLHRYDRALRFFWTVRFWLHRIAGRAEERLSFDLQPDLASAMGYRDTPAVERLMKAYFLKTRDVGSMTRVLCARLESIAAKRAPTGLARFFPQRRRVLKTQGFVTEAGRLDFAGEQIIQDDPLNLLRLFATADEVGCDIHPEALHRVSSQGALIRGPFRRDPAAAALFLHCLTDARQPETLLRLMSESGLLGRYIPEFGHITGRTQFNMYHRYTVDEHSLRAVGILHNMLHGKDEAGPAWVTPVAAAIENRQILLLAMLLHDTGKGLGDQQADGAKTTARACARLGLDARKIRLASWLVGHHLLMSDTAQQRDLSDPRTILDFARTVQTPKRLRLLLLLTIADIRAVGPDVWNGWKERLLRELFEATQSLFRGKQARSLQTLVVHAQDRAEAARKRFLDTIADKAFAQKWTLLLGDSYWTAFEPEAILSQGRWAEDLHAKGEDTGVFLQSLDADSGAVMRVLGKDVPGLFVGLCAAVCLVGGNIAGARIFTTKDGRAFDVFYIQDKQGCPFGHQNPRASLRLQAMAENVLAGRAIDKPPRRSLSRRSAAFTVLPSVVFDNEASEDFTVIETSGHDRQGLLHDLAKVLSQCSLNIASAHIATYGARAVDVFYVHEAGGGKITHGRRRQAIGAKLRRVLQTGNPAQTPAPPGQAMASERQ